MKTTDSKWYPSSIKEKEYDINNYTLNENPRTSTDIFYLNDTNHSIYLYASNLAVNLYFNNNKDYFTAVANSSIIKVLPNQNFAYDIIGDYNYVYYIDKPSFIK